MIKDRGKILILKIEKRSEPLKKSTPKQEKPALIGGRLLQRTQKIKRQSEKNFNY